MRVNIVPIGTSKGVRLPKALLEQCQAKDAFELEVKNGAIILHPVTQPRASWNDAFQAMAAQNDDVLLDQDVKTDFDNNEWEW